MGRQEELISANTATMAKRYRFTLSNSVFGTLVLRYAPDGWKDDEYTVTRNMKYFGIFRKFATLELKFIKDGRDFIKDCYEAYGINAVIGIKVEYYLNSGSWQTRFEGTIDLSTYKISELSVDVQIKDGGFQDLILNRSNIKANLLSRYSIDGVPITAGDMNTVLIPEIDINSNGFLAWDKTSEDDYDGDHVVPVTLLSQNNFTECQTPAQDISSTDGAFFANAQADYPGTLIVMYFRIQMMSISQTFRVQVRRYRSATWTVVNEDIYDLPTYPGYVWTYSQQVSVDIETGDYYVVRIIDDNDDDLFRYVNANISIMYTATNLPERVVMGMTYREAWRALIGMITNNDDAISSTVFNDEILGVLITGRFLRGIDGVNPTFPVSLEELFDSLSIFNIGIGITDAGAVEIERMDYFFNPYIIIDLSDRIKEPLIRKEVIPEMYANTVKFGFNSYEYNTSGGIYEYNTSSEWATILKPIQNDFEILAKYRGDMSSMILAMEETDESQDQQADEDIYMLDVVEHETQDYTARTDEDFTFISGAIKTSILFNLDYSPARTLRRWGQYIRAMLHQNLSSFLRWQTSDKSTTLVTQKTGEDLIAENADIPASALEPNIWIPEAYIATVPLEETDLAAVKDNPYGIVKLSDTKYGWILNFKSKNENRLSEWRLLRVNLDVVTPIPFMQLGYGKLYNWYAVTDSRNIANSSVTSQEKVIKYGYLYNWYAVTNENGFAPDGWHVPTKAECETLIAEVGGESTGGQKLKEEGTDHWNTDNGTDDYGFTARGAGRRYAVGTFLDSMKDMTAFWTATEYDSTDAYCMFKGDDSLTVEMINHDKNTGFSVRLIKNDSNDTGYMTGNDGQVYRTVKIGDQVWMAENSIETMYRGEVPIPDRPDSDEWPLDVQGSRCSYENDEDNAFTIETSSYGWHVPTQGEFSELIDFLGGEATAGGKLKERGNRHWFPPNTGATDEVYFAGLGSGQRNGTDGLFSELKTTAYIWTKSLSTEPGEYWTLGLFNDAESTGFPSLIPESGLAVRLCRLSKQHHLTPGIYIGNDGQRYKTVVINNIEWMIENLKETKYKNGDTIPEEQDDSDWIALSTGAWCHYDNNSQNE